MANRLPVPGGDDGNWGTILNDFLGVEHDVDGTLKPSGTISSLQKLNEKGVALGYASLDSTSKVPTANLGGSGADSTKFLRGDQTWTAPPSAPVTSVAGRVGAVTLTKFDVGLGSVDNTSDVGKPVSTATQTALDAKVAKGSLSINVIDYGADPTGVADSAPAFRAAAAVCMAQGRPMVPSPGTYLFSSLDSASQCFVPLTAGINIRALSPGTVKIQLGSAITSWTAVFGVSASSHADLSGLDIQNITFDGASASNPYPSGNPPRYAINAYRGDNLAVRNCRFQNWDGRNLVLLNGVDNGMTNVAVKDNEGINIGGAVWHDHSSIYVDANGYEVSGNRMWGISTLGPTTPSNAICGYEAHGGAYTYHDNYSWNYSLGANICAPTVGSLTGPVGGCSFTDNHFFNVGEGLLFWMFQKMTDGIVSDNTFDINVDQWPTVAAGGFPAFFHSGIAKVTTSGANPSTGNILCRWKFQNNSFVWRAHSTAAYQADSAIQWVCGNASGLPSEPDTDIEFNGNSFVNCPSSYFYSVNFTGMYRWSFNDRIYNLGTGLFDSVKFRAGWYLRNGSNVVDCHFGGQFIDDISGATQYLTRLITGENVGAETIPTFADCDMHDIQVVSSATTPPLLAALQAGQSVDLRARVATYRALTGAFTAGSEIVETSTGTIRRQSTAPTGNSWATVGAVSPSTSIITATNTSWPIPVGAAYLEITGVGGGGQGGGAGSAAAAQLQTGGGGGAAGTADSQVVAVGANTTLNVTIGTGGSASGAGGPAGGNLGSSGATGVATTITGTGISVSGLGGRGGAGSAASSTTAAGGGLYGSGNTTVQGPTAGSGGFSGLAGGHPSGFSAGGGAGGSAATATNGGAGGGAGTKIAVGAVAGGSAGSGAAGGNGAAASDLGSPGGGGGGGAAGTGAGGNGGAGASGYAVIKVVG
jgi:hypothetical protein